MDKVELIPWDPRSEQHFERLYNQRVACGWHEETIPKWKEAQLAGTKVLYWTVLSDDLPDRELLLSQHLARYPKEHDHLVDTSAEIFGIPREATSRKFIPVGHVSLEIVTPAEAEDMALPLKTAWIYALYISWALHRGGIGRGALAAAERAAASSPVNATIVALNTLQKEVQQSERYLKKAFDDRGMTRPKEFWTNQDWYARQGYEVIPGPQFALYVDTTTKEVEDVPIVWLKKELN